MLTPDDKDDGRLRVVIGTRLTLSQYNALRAAYPDMKDGEALRDLVEALRRDNKSVLERDIEDLRKQLQEKEDARREAADKEKELQMEVEEQQRREAATQEAERVRARWLGKHGSDITKWVHTALEGGPSDPLEYIESLSPPDEVARDRAATLAKNALAKRKGDRK